MPDWLDDVPRGFRCVCVDCRERRASGYLLSSPPRQVMNHTDPRPPPNTTSLDERRGNCIGGPLMTGPDVWPASKAGETMEETHLSSVAAHGRDLHSALISFLPALIHL